MAKQGISNKAIMDRTLSESYTAGYKEGMKAVSEIVYYIDAYRTGHLTTSDYDVIKSEMNKLGIKMK